MFGLIRLTGDSAFNNAPTWFKFTFLGIIIVIALCMYYKFREP